MARPILFLALAVAFLGPWLSAAMRPGHAEGLRDDTVRMFLHGFRNYMEHGFPEDEVRQARRHAHRLPLKTDR